jgi:hypothetical protein
MISLSRSVVISWAFVIVILSGGIGFLAGRRTSQLQGVIPATPTPAVDASLPSSAMKTITTQQPELFSQNVISPQPNAQTYPLTPYPTLPIDAETATWPLNIDLRGYSFRYPTDWKNDNGVTSYLYPDPNYDGLIFFTKYDTIPAEQTPFASIFKYYGNYSLAKPLTIAGYPALRVYEPSSGSAFLEAQYFIIDPSKNSEGKYPVYQFYLGNGGEGVTNPLPPSSAAFQNELHKFDQLVSTFKKTK